MISNCSFVRKLLYVSRVSIRFDVAMATIKFHVGLTKSRLFLERKFCIYFFLQFCSSNGRNSWICTFHKHSSVILRFFSWLFQTLMKSKSSEFKMADQMIWSSCWASLWLPNQCKFISFFLTERESRGGFHPPFPCVTVGSASSL